jgi:FKBP-type peptidyl-prolyl cis-trans isomerase SlyD
MKPVEDFTYSEQISCAYAKMGPSQTDYYFRRPMKIEKNTAVTLRYKLTDSAGKVLEQGDGPMTYLHGGYGNIFPKVEQALEGKMPGFQTTLDLQARDAFGERDERLLQTISRAEFPPGVKVGGQLQGQGPDGQAQMFTVAKIKGNTVMLDGNHPLAGKALRFSVTVAAVRAANEEEIAHGHVHGAHGHHH